jgi:hypothetical protein
MKREDRMLLAIEKGYTCNPETGEVFGIKGGLVKSKSHGYIIIQLCVGRKLQRISAHQFIYYWVNKKCVDCIDHINRDKLDNRIENLREATYSVNARNTIGLGYTICKNNKKNPYCAHIEVDYKKIHLGYFDTPEKAHKIYLEAKEKYHKNI